jgi:hypothetical protein
LGVRRRGDDVDCDAGRSAGKSGGGVMSAPLRKQPAPAQSPLRALTLFEALPRGHKPLRVEDGGSFPHLKVGEHAVIDTTDVELQKGEMYVIQYESGLRIAAHHPDQGRRDQPHERQPSVRLVGARSCWLSSARCRAEFSFSVASATAPTPRAIFRKSCWGEWWAIPKRRWAASWRPAQSRRKGGEHAAPEPAKAPVVTPVRPRPDLSA